MLRLLAGAVLAHILCSAPVSAQGAGAGLPVEVWLSGTVFLNPPQFIVEADGHIIGRGEVGAAYDEAVEGNAQITPAFLQSHSEWFRFQAPAGVDPREIAVSLTNDRAGGPERADLDRNLFVLEIKVGGQPINPDTMILPSQGVELFDGIVAIYGNETVRVARPDGGWSCAIFETVEITGFAPNSAALPEDMLALLQDIKTRMEGQSCSILVSGYSSTDGPPEWNAELAKMRADAVAAFLSQEAGIAASQVQTESMGEVTEFGNNLSNRRVVVQVGVPEN
jgi:outer membrane protein OmpA-like peptidoglycan-associated protein